MIRIKPAIILGILGLALIITGCIMGSQPSVNPTETPTLFPTMSPSVSPSAYPTISPTRIPTMLPSPGATPSMSPTMAPTIIPADQYAEDVIRSLPPGRIMFNPPQEMTTGVKERVEVRISKDLQDNITEELSGRGTPQVANISVGTFMTVRLTGDNFEIAGLSHEEQPVTSDSPTEWDFDVTPLKSGDQNLVLRATIRIRMPDGKVEYKDYPVFDRQIKVNVNPVYSISTFIGENWQWLFATVFGGTSLVGIIATVIGWMRKRNSEKTKTDEPKPRKPARIKKKK